MQFKARLGANYRKIITGAIMILLILLCVSQYRSKELYKEHISSEMNQDFIQFIACLQANTPLYNDILNAERITEGQAGTLANNNQCISSTIQQYVDLAVKLKLWKEGSPYIQSALNAQKITLLFHEMPEGKLDADQMRILQKVQELNAKWIAAAEGTESQEYPYKWKFSLSDSLWLELIENIESSTLVYLKENDMGSIEELWLQRTEIK